MLGCSSESNTAKNDDFILIFDKEKFEEEKKLWENLELKNYSFIQDYRSGTGHVWGKITVSEDFMTDFQNLHNPEDNYYRIWYGTISDIYRNVEKETNFNNYDNLENILKIECVITYNSIYHYPELIKQDVYYKVVSYGGGGYTLKISDFKVE